MMKEYATYSVEELAADVQFMQWVRQPDKESEQFWRDWLRTNPDKEQLVAEARKLVLSLGVKEQSISNKQIGNLWNRISSGIEQEHTQPVATVRTLPYKWWYVGIAASVVLLIGLAFFLSRPTERTLVAEKGQHRSYYLPDSSLVLLNADSRIKIREGSWDEQRSVYLEGEGFFEVKKGSRFTVHTPKGTVAVLGTSFNVFVRNTLLEVACYTGKVQVRSAQSASEVVLTAGMRTQNDSSGKLSIENFQPEPDLHWRSGIFTYEQAPLHQVLEEVERQYAIDIQPAVPLEKRRFQGSLDMKEMPLDSILTAICYPYFWEYEQAGDQWIIRAK